MNSPASASASWSKRKPWAIPAGLTALALAGLATWQFWPSGDPTLSIPEKVCEGALPSDWVKTLLPERGESFQEKNAYNYSDATPGGRESPGGGKCNLSGGGEKLMINWYRMQSAGFTPEDLERDAAKPGSTPIKLGEAWGYHSGPGVDLFASCPYTKDRGALLAIQIGLSGLPDEVDRATIQHLANLAADAARVVARDVIGCEGAENLPDGPPRLN
ncbi:hypothetical protein HRW07_30540 [Streptomyces lunaelactis]|uniref:hypothetical protein n=1 Tax=Streptomyces lunaelactis TaxID=1535768 RepID=UPI0015855B1E|nr:hypothetical protein [Streptomyces lunaelactis]NUL07480.1 hypothetical protein [Streptomyces lunaelactis]